MTELDGKRQRNALTAAERSIESLGRGNADRAVRSARKAADLDQLGLFGGLPGAVGMAASELEETGAVSDASWDMLTEAVGPGPIGFLIAELRA